MNWTVLENDTLHMLPCLCFKEEDKRRKEHTENFLMFVPWVCVLVSHLEDHSLKLVYWSEQRRLRQGSAADGRKGAWYEVRRNLHKTYGEDGWWWTIDDDWNLNAVWLQVGRWLMSSELSDIEAQTRGRTKRVWSIVTGGTWINATVSPVICEQVMCKIWFQEGFVFVISYLTDQS